MCENYLAFLYRFRLLKSVTLSPPPPPPPKVAPLLPSIQVCQCAH